MIPALCLLFSSPMSHSIYPPAFPPNTQTLASLIVACQLARTIPVSVRPNPSRQSSSPGRSVGDRL
jgi:hypothetical protein